MTIPLDSTFAQPSTQTKVLGELLFTLADDELEHEPDFYHELHEPHQEKPKKSAWKELLSLRPELDSLSKRSEEEQLDIVRSNLAQRGLATLPHHSQVLADKGIDTQADYSAFIKENQE